jgi:DNA ligase-associated metallophosphoesterase
MSDRRPEPTGDAETTVVGENVVLMPERALYWPCAETLFVADPHFGKAAAFRAAGVPVPRGTTEENLRRLDSALTRCRARRLVFLGDFLHAREGRAPDTLRTWYEWRVGRATIEMLLVRGNHDKRAADPPTELDIRCVDGPVVERPFVFSHRPAQSNDGYVLCGHIHPGARLRGAGRQSLWLPCFWFGARTAVMPAFGEFTGLADIDVVEGDRVWVVADDTVVRVTAP